ncbi:nucleotide-diphospho-sugar transferase, partial [Tilletiopsis washingtonensis]
AWATLMTGEKYLPGLAVFAHSLLREHKSAYPLVVMTTGKLSEEARQCVLALGCEIREVKDLRPEVAGTNMAYARFGDVWTKLRAFELAEYERVIMVDSDMLVRRNMDELMTLPLDDGMQIAAGFACTCNPAKMASYPKDWIPENCAFTPQSHPAALTQPLKLDASSMPTHKLLNSGLVVLTPSSETMRAMEQRLNSDPSVKEMAFPDQDFLAAFYAGAWQPLPWVYNALKKLRAAHADMWRDDKVANVHYIIDKPWESLPSDEHPDAVTHGWWW